MSIKLDYIRLARKNDCTHRTYNLIDKDNAYAFVILPAKHRDVNQ